MFIELLVACDYFMYISMTLTIISSSREVSDPILMENLSASLPEAACSQQVSEPSS